MSRFIERILLKIKQGEQLDAREARHLRRVIDTQAFYYALSTQGTPAEISHESFLAEVGYDKSVGEKARANVPLSIEEARQLAVVLGRIQEISGATDQEVSDTSFTVQEALSDTWPED